MITLELSPENAEALEALLRRELTDLKVEIHRTDSWDFREELRVRQSRLAECLKQLEEARGRAAA
ncbi:MAG TPA: hypothetical protein VNN18_06675 [Candidatus Xenobia bacterium]|nr:hypothetical protein [Candidatus Xenobia bacterium]